MSTIHMVVWILDHYADHPWITRLQFNSGPSITGFRLVHYLNISKIQMPGIWIPQCSRQFVARALQTQVPYFGYRYKCHQFLQYFILYQL